MPDRPRLIVLGSAITALAVARDARGLGLDAILIDRRRGVACSTRRARSEVFEGADDETILNRIHTLARSRPGSCLIATSDDWVRFVRRHCSALSAALAHVLHPSAALLDVCLDKVAFAEWCRRHSIPSPDAHPPTAPVRLPVILRPSRTLHDAQHQGLPKAIEVATEPDLRDWLQRFKRSNVTPVLTESLLGRPLVQLSVPFVRTRETTLAYVARKLRPGPNRCAAGTYVEARPDAAAERLARQVVEALGFEGIGEIEILRDERTREDFVIEVNPRPWSQFAMASRLGFDFLGTALGRPRARRRQSGVWVDFTNDLYTVLSRSEGMMTRGEIGWAGYLRSLLRADVNATFDLHDPRPFVTEVLAFLLQRWQPRGRLTKQQEE